VKTVKFNDVLLFHNDNRPYVDVKIVTSSASVTIKCLVDTGADYLQLPDVFANQAGLSLHNATTKRVKSAGGVKTTMQLMQNVDVELEGKRFSVDVMFGPHDCMCLAGRQALLTAFDIGMDDRS
jgi:predicted aspartyl protease